MDSPGFQNSINRVNLRLSGQFCSDQENFVGPDIKVLWAITVINTYREDPLFPSGIHYVST